MSYFCSNVQYVNKFLNKFVGLSMLTFGKRRKKIELLLATAQTGEITGGGGGPGQSTVPQIASPRQSHVCVCLGIFSSFDEQVAPSVILIPLVSESGLP